jgi:DNA-binding PadR family transcriptional regulator
MDLQLGHFPPLLACFSQRHHGYAISRQTGIPSGMIYPAPMRLDKPGWLETRSEDSDPQGRPPRHLYHLTGHSRERAREELRSARQQEFYKSASNQT